jgi:phospholipase C
MEAASPQTGNLAKIEHIVVLMLENRSFDHMLGYLSLEGRRTDIDGLQAGMSNPHDGRDFAVHHLTTTQLPGKDFDPDHSGEAADRQINGSRMDGFVDSYAATLESRGVTDADPGLIMGYFNAGDVPVYDHLAAEFCVCDRWHSSVPGATWPNRLYAVAGSADGSRDDKPGAPIYDKHSFVRHLDAAKVTWRWYSFDPGTLRCADGEYLIGHHEHFAFVDKVKLKWAPELAEGVVIDEDSASFLEDAVRGRLPAVSWIDPNFNDLNLVGSPSNDDHPPSDILDGQELVFRVYNALACSPQWEKTLFIVVYDEHGGFHDHVPPPEADDDDPAMFGRYGVRVPAMIVSPWVEPASVSHDVYDHTSIIKTILARFCPEELTQRRGIGALVHWLDDGHPHYMGKRVSEARDLGGVLSRTEPRPPPDRTQPGDVLAARRAAMASFAVKSPPTVPASSRPLTDLQVHMAAASEHLRARGLPPGQP